MALNDELSLEASESIPADETAAEAVRCAGPCDRSVHKAATVDVAAGASVGEWDDPKPHVGITGVDGGSPVVEHWCVKCAKVEFGVEESARSARVEKAREYITPSNVASVLLGFALALLLASMFII